MRRWLAALMVLSACAGGGHSQPTTAPASLPTVADVSDAAAGDAVITAPATAPTAGSTSLTSSTTLADPDLVVPNGFDLVGARATTADGTTCDLCLWLADSSELRSQGLMGVTDFGSADGMAFVYPGPTTTRFWMKDTPLPLSIAFYGSGGEFLDSFDMDPCVSEDSAECVRYPTPRGFVVAVETHQGGLAELDMTAGSTLTLLDLPCQP